MIVELFYFIQSFLLDDQNDSTFGKLTEIKIKTSGTTNDYYQEIL